MTKTNLTPILHMPLTPVGTQKGAIWLRALSDAYHTNPRCRSELGADPTAALAALGENGGVEVPPDVEMRIVEDSDEVFHFVFPPDWNASMGDEALDMVAGGKSAAAVASPAPQIDTRTEQQVMAEYYGTTGVWL